MSKKHKEIKVGDIVLYHNPRLTTTTNLITDVVEDLGERAVIRASGANISTLKKNLVKIPVDKNFPILLATKHRLDLVSR